MNFVEEIKGYILKKNSARLLQFIERIPGHSTSVLK